MTDILDLLRRCRSCRRYRETEPVPDALLADLAEAARIAPSARNLQPLKYLASNDPETNARIFPCLAWAGYLTDWDGPAEGERPAAYLIQLLDRSLAARADVDAGLALQNIQLTAVSRGLGACIIGAVRREELARILELPEHLEILHVVALGRPAETVILETQTDPQAYRYWRDENGTHHVPKRPLEEILIRKRTV